MLEKDSSELKVLAITINSKVKQAFECSKEQSSWSFKNSFEFELFPYTLPHGHHHHYHQLSHFPKKIVHICFFFFNENICLNFHFSSCPLSDSIPSCLLSIRNVQSIAPPCVLRWCIYWESGSAVYGAKKYSTVQRGCSEVKFFGVQCAACSVQCAVQ